MEYYFECQDCEQVKNILASLQKKGYRFIARDEDSDFIHCYSHKPKKYLNGGFWGYTDSDLVISQPAIPIKNTDILKVNWSNRSAFLISDFLKD